MMTKTLLLAASALLTCGVGLCARPAPDAYAAFRAELRAFYPDRFQGDPVKDSRQKASVAAIEKDLRAFCAANPGYDALDVRRESYGPCGAISCRSSSRRVRSTSTRA